MIFHVNAKLNHLRRAVQPLAADRVRHPQARREGRGRRANYWNFFGWFDTYFLSEEEGRRVDLTMGPSIDHYRLHEDVRTVIGTQAPLAAQTFTSPPVSSESQAWLEFPDD